MSASLSDYQELFGAIEPDPVVMARCLGGIEVDDPTGLPFIEQLAEIGEVNISAFEAPEAPVAP